MAERASASETAQQALEATQAALGDAQRAWGSATDLGGTRVWAHSLAEASRARSAKEAEISTGGAAAEGLRSSLEAATQRVAEAAQAMAARKEELLQDEARLEEARHADLVSAVATGLKAGDPCPVCGAPLKKGPPRSKTGALDRATRAAEKRRKEVDGARKALTEAERAADSARRDVEANAAEVVRLHGEIDELDRTIVAECRRLTEALGDPLPEDPGAEIDRRLAELQQLDQTERQAARDAAEAAQALMKAEQERDRVLASIDRQRDRLVADRRPLFDRAARALGKRLPGIELPPEPDTGADSVGRYADQLAGALAAFAAQLAGAVAEIASLERRLLEEATEAVEGLVEEQPTLEALARSVNESCRHATSAVATTRQRSNDLATRLERKKQLVEELKLLEERATLFRALALELRADRLIAFLQEEALQVLAAAGSERLASISDGRYRLGCRGDEFFVVDTWNGDEERSVRTLSGGETFLASLALALALADQVRSISSTDRARLDSLFLDEGFGTLDQETLRVVVDAIGQLAGDGRLVGLITHVRELAEQFPRLEVEKSPRGSRLKIVA
jgi:exonuclease SbcC